MNRRSRSQVLMIWHQIANGLLYEPGRLPHGDIPSRDYYEAIDFLTEISSAILKADESNPQQRARSLLSALELDGKQIPDEIALRKTLDILEDFSDTTQKVAIKTTANLARSFISNTTLPDGRKRSAEDKTDIAIKRQLRELKNRNSQDKK